MSRGTSTVFHDALTLGRYRADRGEWGVNMGVQRSGSALRVLKVELPHQLGSIKGQIVKGSFFLPSNRFKSAVLDHGYRYIVILGPV